MLAPYAALLRISGVPRLVAASTVARIPFGMVALALILLIEDATGSYAVAGAVEGAYGLAGGIGSPLAGRAIGRFGQTRVLVPTALANAGGLAALVALVETGAPRWSWFAVAALSGLTFPSLGAAIRGLWPEIAGDRLTAAMALEAILLDVFFIVGPTLAAALSAVASPAVAVLAGAAMSAGGCIVYATAPVVRRWRARPEGTARGGSVWRSPAARTMMLIGFPIGMTFGFMEVGLTAFADDHGAAEASGLLISAQAVASVLGGIYYGSLRHERAVIDRSIRLAVAFGALMGLLVVPDAMLLMGVVCFVTGLVLAPFTTVIYELTAEASPSGALVEVNTWGIAFVASGLSAGSALAGALVEGPGVTAALAGASAAGLATAVWLVARRGTLAGGGSLPAHV
jgi:MFS family permease